MKRNVLKLTTLYLAIAALYFVLNDRARAERTTATAAPQEKTVEQVEKNIKVLNGMPASQLIPVMNFFATSMGRRCNFCHVNNNGQWDYAADTKPEKNTAREMIKLVLDTNNRFAQLKLDPISCYVCHRGRNNPQLVPTLPLPIPSPQGNQGGQRPAPAPGQTPPPAPGQTPPPAQGQASPVPRPSPPAADDILNQYV